jgi:hypothetical protein
MLQAYVEPTMEGLRVGKEVGVEVGVGAGVEQVVRGRVGKGREGKGRVEVVARAPHSGCSRCHLSRSHLQMCGCAGVDVQPGSERVSTTWVTTDGSSKRVRWCMVPTLISHTHRVRCW